MDDQEHRALSNEVTPEMWQLRFEYSWRWFDLVAKQRVTMFSFFLLIAGVYGNGYVLTLRDGHHTVAAIIGTLGAFTSIVFIVFDIRNRQLLTLGEALLCEIEAKWLFVSFKGSTDDRQLGIHFSEHLAEQTLARKPLLRLLRGVVKYKVLVRGTEGVIGLTFLGAAIYPFTT